jgi:type II secretion system protein G
VRNIAASQKTGFTLIELLIVVAIIAILAAIAVPNFLEAQTRAKVGRVKTDMRSLATALEAYRTDFSKYPSGRDLGQMVNDYLGVLPIGFWVLTTPVAYITSIPFEPFQNKNDIANNRAHYFYFSDTDIASDGSDARWPLVMNWYVYTLRIGVTLPDLSLTGSVGVDDCPHNWELRSNGPALFAMHAFPYDPTNGTKSAGNIVRWGP